MPLLPKNICDTITMDFDSLIKEKSGLGTAGIVVINKNQDIKYSNSDKNYFNNIIKTEKNVSLLNETDVKKNLDYYNSFDAKKFDQLNNFPEYKYINEKINESVNSENSYSSKDYDEFNKIIKTKNKKEEAINNQNKKVKIIDYGKLKESEKKLKNKLGIEKIKVVYFD